MKTRAISSKVKIFYLISIFFLSGATVNADFCSSLNGSIIAADDGTYLGTLSSNSFSKDSIANEFGTYGSPFNTKSIFNQFGTYGSQFNTKSPWNQFSTSGPLIIKGDKTLGRLTINQFAKGALNTFSVLLCFIDASDDRFEPFLDLLSDTTNTNIYPPIKKDATINSITPSGKECEAKYGAIFDYTSNTCNCEEGKSRSADKTWCAPAPTSIKLCQTKYGINATVEPYTIDPYECACKSGYTWSSDKKYCIIDSNPSINNTMNLSNGEIVCKFGYINEVYKWKNSDKANICISADTELQNAISWMYNNGLTIYNTIDNFMGEEYLTREQAAKFFVQFTKGILGKNIDNTKTVNFTDLKKADKTLQSYIKESYQLGLFNGVNGKFLPSNKLTQAQAIAAIIRAKEGMKDQSKAQWYEEYFYTASRNWILGDGEFHFFELDSTNIKRKEIAVLMYRLSGGTNNPSIKDGISTR